MRKFAAIVTAVGGVAAPALAADMPAAGSAKVQSDDRRWEAALNVETRYLSWSGTRGFPADASTARGSGAQHYTPVSLQAAGLPADDVKVELLVKTGYVWSRQSTPGLTGSVSTLTDTVLAGALTYGGLPGIQPFVSLNINAPTGRSALRGAAANARMDPDIVDLATFGEGWNFGPTVGANVPISDATTWSFGVGHTFRGGYDREGPAADPDALIRIDPGDVTTATVSVGTEIDKFTFEGTAAYSTESATDRDGAASFQLGDRYLLSVAASYAWTNMSKSTVVASWNYYRKNRILAPPSSDLVIEAFNSNSNVYYVNFEHLFKHRDWTFGPTARYMLRDANSYSPATLQFVPAKTLWGAGVIVAHSIDEQMAVKASVERIWVQEKENPGVSVPALTVDAWTFMIGTVITR